MSLKIASSTYYSFSEYKGNVKSIDSIDGNGIVIPEGFVSIGSIYRSAGMIIPDTVISIGEIHYSSLIIPASVESISKIKGSGDGGNDKNKITISLKSKIPPMIGSIVDLSRFDSLMVPQGALNAYKNHPIWGKFKNILENPRLNSLTPNTTGTTSSNNDEIAEIRNEIFELRNEIDDLKNKINNPKNMNSESNSVLGLFSKLFEK